MNSFRGQTKKELTKKTPCCAVLGVYRLNISVSHASMCFVSTCITSECVRHDVQSDPEVRMCHRCQRKTTALFKSAGREGAGDHLRRAETFLKLIVWVKRGRLHRISTFSANNRCVEQHRDLMEWRKSELTVTEERVGAWFCLFVYFLRARC